MENYLAIAYLFPKTYSGKFLFENDPLPRYDQKNVLDIWKLAPRSDENK